MKNAWSSFTSFFGGEESTNYPSPQKKEPSQRKEKENLNRDKDFLVQTYESLLYAKTKSHGVTIKTMTKVHPSK